MGIIITWDYGKEYLDHIDPNNLEDLQEFNTTIEWWHQECELVTYNVVCQIEWNGQGAAGGCIVVLTYNQQDNEHIDPEGVVWGINRIVIEPGQDHGVCYWTADGEEEIEWEWQREALLEPRDHRRSHQQIRDQAFRHLIIKFDGMCVISGETTEAALDAAHIIPAAKNGNEIPENGITLRADIHRLYDADIHRQYDSGMFIIYPETGQTVIDPERRLARILHEKRTV